jgi:uncharacterized protein (DUF433 family)
MGMKNSLERIDVNPELCHGQACIRVTRVMDFVILYNLGTKATRAEILEKNPAPLRHP